MLKSKVVSREVWRKFVLVCWRTNPQLAARPHCMNLIYQHQNLKMRTGNFYSRLIIYFTALPFLLGCLIFCTCHLWPWFGPPMVALWYVLYFQFCRWCHVFILDFSVGLLAFSNPAHSYFNFPYLRFPSLHSHTWIFRTCIFHSYTFCHFVLHFSLFRTCIFQYLQFQRPQPIYSIVDFLWILITDLLGFYTNWVWKCNFLGCHTPIYGKANFLGRYNITEFTCGMFIPYKVIYMNNLWIVRKKIKTGLSSRAGVIISVLLSINTA